MLSCKKQEFLVIEFVNCPDLVKTELRQRYNFRLNTYLDYCSNLSPTPPADWGSTLTMQNLQSYWKAEIAAEQFTGTLDRFIESYYLVVDKWLIDTKFDFIGVNNILFHIYW